MNVEACRVSRKGKLCPKVNCLCECLLEKSQKTKKNERNDAVLQSTSTLRCFCCCFNRFSFFIFGRLCSLASLTVRGEYIESSWRVCVHYFCQACAMRTFHFIFVLVYNYNVLSLPYIQYFLLVLFFSHIFFAKFTPTCCCVQSSSSSPLRFRGHHEAD